MAHTSSSSSRLFTVCVLKLYGRENKEIGEYLGMNEASVSRICASPKGRELLTQMQGRVLDYAIDPIKQTLAEYASTAAEKLYELMEADAENVQLSAARTILEMSGYTPKRQAAEEKPAAPTIMVGTMNIAQMQPPTHDPTSGEILDPNEINVEARSMAPTKMLGESNGKIDDVEETSDVARIDPFAGWTESQRRRAQQAAIEGGEGIHGSGESGQSRQGSEGDNT